MHVPFSAAKKINDINLNTSLACALAIKRRTLASELFQICNNHSVLVHLVVVQSEQATLGIVVLFLVFEVEMEFPLKN